MSKIYRPKGHYFADDDATIVVEENGVATPLAFAGGKARHSPDGFSWGYWGSGPAELARAILADVLKDPDPPAVLYQAFKVDKIATIPQDSLDWIITEDEVQEWFVSKAEDPKADYIEKRCPSCGGRFTGDRCPHGNCEHGWPHPDSEGREEQ
jgi:hypothetical protein